MLFLAEIGNVEVISRGANFYDVIENVFWKLNICKEVGVLGIYVSN